MSLVIYLFHYDSCKSTSFILNVAFDFVLGTVFVKSLTHSLTHWSNLFGNFLSVADLRVDGRSTYQQSQCSPQSNSNSQPEYTKLYLPVSTTLALLPAIRSSICLDPTLWPAWLGKTCQKLKRPPVYLSGLITQAPPPLQSWWFLGGTSTATTRLMIFGGYYKHIIKTLSFLSLCL